MASGSKNVDDWEIPFSLRNTFGEKFDSNLQFIFIS